MNNPWFDVVKGLGIEHLDFYGMGAIGVAPLHCSHHMIIDAYSSKYYMLSSIWALNYGDFNH